MFISPIVAPGPFFGVGSVSPTAPLQSLLALQGTQSLQAIDSRSTYVELTGMGQLLSAIASFDQSLAVFRPGAADSGIGANFGTDFASLAAEAQYFVDAFNNLQNGVNALQGPFGALNGELLTTRLTGALDSQALETFDNGDSSLTRLADLGVEFTPNPVSGLGGSLTVDLQALEAAFNADPEGSFALLGAAADTFRGVAADFTVEVGTASATLTELASLTATQQALGLFGTGLATSTNGLQNMAGLFALASLGQGNTGSQAQALLAINEFSLVSTLLG